MSMPAMRAATVLVTGLALAALAQPVQAETQVNATGACKSALPVFDGEIRSRPLGVRNEGTATAFVSCSLYAEYDTAIDLLGLYITNTSPAAATVNCTMVNGRNTFGPQYTPATITLAAGVSGWMTFAPETPPVGGDLPNFSCSLVPGTEINILASIPATP